MRTFRILSSGGKQFDLTLFFIAKKVKLYNEKQFYERFVNCQTDFLFSSSYIIKMRISPLLIACSQAAEPTFYDEFDDLSNWIINVVPDSQNNEYQYYTDSDGVFYSIFP